MKKYFFLFFILNQITTSIAQNGLAYYNNYTNNFFVFDKGIERQIEDYPVSDVKVGNDYLTYVDSKKSFVCYYNGAKQVLEENLPNAVVATPNAVVYKMQQRLMVCEKGEKKLLSPNAGDFVAGDSLVIWQAYPTLNFMAYENGKINAIIYATGSGVVTDFKVGSNVMAFNDLDYTFKVYFKGKIYDSNNNRITNYACGHNIAAFVNEYTNTFNVFYNGTFSELSKDVVQDYRVANDMVAFVDAKSNFYIFYKGSLVKIDSRKPDFYYSKGNILYYSYNTELNIVYEGNVYKQKLVDEHSIKPGDNSVFFYSNINSPQFFYKGKVISNFYVQKPYTVSLNQDLPVFKYNTTIGILYNEKIFEYGTRAN